MKPEEAFNVIDKLLADFKGTRTDHQLILQSLQVIKTELDKAAAPKGKKEASKEDF